MEILVIRGGGVGDFILTLPLLNHLKEDGIENRLHLVGNSSIFAVAARQSYFDTSSDLSDPLVARLFSSQGITNGEVKQFLSGFDSAVSFLDDSEGLLQRNLREFIPETIFVSHPDGKCHAARHFLSHVRELSATEPTPILKLLPSEEARRQSREWMTANRLDPGCSFVALHAGSGSGKKNWPPASYAAVINTLIKFDIEVLLIEGEADREAVSSLTEATRHKLPVARELPLTTLAGVLTRCKAYLGNDSGISHLAAALGLPATVLFGPTSPEVWRPLGPHVEVLKFEEARPPEIAANIATKAR